MPKRVQMSGSTAEDPGARARGADSGGVALTTPPARPVPAHDQADGEPAPPWPQRMARGLSLLLRLLPLGAGVVLWLAGQRLPAVFVAIVGTGGGLAWRAWRNRPSEEERTRLEEERIQREIDAAAKRARDAVPVPPQWLGLPVVGAVAWLVLVAATGVGWWCFTRDEVPWVIAVMVSALWVHSAGLWLSRPSGARATWYVVMSIVAAGALWLRGDRSVAVAVAAAGMAGAVVWQARTALLRRRVHRFAWAAAKLAEATGDERELHKILAPARTSSGLPARWYLPDTSTKRMTVSAGDQESEGEDEETARFNPARAFDPARVLSQALGSKVTVRITQSIGVVTAAVARSAAAERALTYVRRRLGKVDVEVIEDAKGQVQAIEAKGIDANKMLSPHARASHERALGVLLPGRWRAVWDLRADKVRFEQRPAMSTKIPHEPQPITSDNKFLIPLAKDEDGNWICWNLSGTGPHLIVVGKTGTGKTVLINGAVLELALRQWRVRICDPKRTEFAGLRDWPNVEVVATSVEHMVATIWLTHELMMQRYAQVEAGTADEDDFEPVVLVLDEFRNFHRQVASWYARIKVRGMPSKCDVFDWVASIAEMGRTARIHLLMGTQRPDAEFMTGSMRDNFDSRASLGRLSPQGAEMMWESRVLGTTVPRGVRGRGTGLSADGRIVEMQALWTPDPRRAARRGDLDDLAILEQLRPATITYPPRVVELGPETDLAGVEQSEWDRVLEAQLVIRALLPSVVAVGAQEDPALPAAELTEVEDEEESADYGDEQAYDPFDGYGAPEDVGVQAVAIGDMFLVDASTDQWAVVDDVEPDPTGDPLICISWRDDEGDEGVAAFDEDDSVTVRRPLDDISDPDSESDPA